MQHEMTKKYLIIPSVPTPNGRLHLGHIAGPYLKADILARHLRMQGHQAVIISGTDPYESYVTAQAEKEQISPEAICQKYHQAIHDDLAFMQIKPDAFVNPLEHEWSEKYLQWHHTILTSLEKANSVKIINETVAQDQKRYLVGCWLQGQCPVCDANITGYFCEDCGAHFRPEEAALTSDNHSSSVSNVFMKLPNSQNLSNINLNDRILTIYHNFLTQQNNLLRLTANSDWGLPHAEHRTLFNYGFIYAYFLMFGEISSQLFDIDENAFSLESPIETICLFGIDNTVPFLASTLGISTACHYKPFDHYLINYFLYLDGKKFSTSRRHAIWVNDIKKWNLSSDIVRFFLASIDISQQTGNFDKNEFIHFYQTTALWIEQLIIESFTSLPENTGDCDEMLSQKINQVLIDYADILQPHNFNTCLATHIIQNWILTGREISQHTENYFWWLKALSILIYPFMPCISGKIWSALGYSGNPYIQNFYQHPQNALAKLTSASYDFNRNIAGECI